MTDTIDNLLTALQVRSTQPFRALYLAIVTQPRLQRELAVAVGTHQVNVAKMLERLTSYGLVEKGEKNLYYPRAAPEQQAAALLYVERYNASQEAYYALQAFWDVGHG